MATFEEQVEGITGVAIATTTAPTQDQLTQFLRDGVLDVTSRCLAAKPEDVQSFQRTTTSDSQGVGVGGAKIISVMRESGGDGSSDGSAFWRVCRKVSPALQSRVVDVDSIHYASQYNPVYLIENNNTINVYPTPSSNNGIKIFYVNEEPRDISNNANLTYAHSNIKYFPNDKVYLVVLYASMKSLQKALALVEKEDFPDTLVAPILSTPVVSIPVYTGPSDFVLPASPENVDVDFGTLTTLETFTSPNLDFKPITISDLTINSSVPAAPSIDLGSVTITGTAPTYNEPVISPDYSDANTWLNVEEDNEMVAARIQIIQTQLQEYQANIQNQLNKFNKENAEYQAKLQKDMQDAQLAESEEGRKLQKYANDLQTYQAEVNTEIQKYQQNFQKDFQLWQTERQTDLQKYGSDIQKQTAKVQSSLGNYQAEVAKALQEYQSETGYDITKYQAQIQAEVQKFNNDLTKASTDFTNNLQKYSKNIEAVNMDNQSKISKFTAEVQNYNSILTKVSSKVQFMQARYAAIKADYEAAFLLMAPQQRQQPAGQER